MKNKQFSACHLYRRIFVQIYIPSMRLLFLFLFLPALAFTQAQTPPEKGQEFLRPHWKKGEIKTYRCSFGEERSFQKDTFYFGGGIYDMEVEVLEASNAGMTLRWRLYNNARIENGDTIPFSDPVYDSIRYIVKTDANGAFLGVENWQSIGEAVGSKYVAMLNDPNSRADLITLAKLRLRQYRNQAINQRMSMHEICSYFIFFGKELSPGHTRTYQDTMLNFFSGEPAWHVSNYMVLEKTSATDPVHAIVHISVDETPVTEAVHFFLRMGADLYGRPINNDLSSFQPAQFTEFIRSDLYPETGWIVESYTYRVFTSSGWRVAQGFSLQEK
ncbi:MAG: hypothetical protein IT270_19145 [Saprospiraceae bacterium]|nr:hypothetical protein [Saprospiraceae bacterium]